MAEEHDANVEEQLIDGGEPDDAPDLDEAGKPKDKANWVRRSSLTAVAKQVRELKEELDREKTASQARIDALAAAKAEPVKPVQQQQYTRAQLNAMVANGQCTQDQADAQIEFQITQRAVNAAQAATSATVKQERIASDLERYKGLEPDVMKTGSEVRARIAEEFNYLVNEMGEPGGANDPNTLRTQLKAMRAVLGPIDKLELAKSGRNGAEPDKQSGGDSRNSGDRKARTEWDKLDQKLKDYYGPRIGPGKLYPSREAVMEERRYAKAR